MKPFFQIIFPVAVFLLLSWTPPEEKVLASGTQPQLSVDNTGIIRLVFGRSDSIFCATSADQGNSFSNPVFVAHIAGMHLGMARGPQIASSLNSTIITAMDKSGDIHGFQLNHANKKWTNKGLINDMKSSAPEGLMSIAADNHDNFYAVWLDTRKDKMNNIYFSTFPAEGNTWKKNALVYASPDSHVCECCKPGIAVKNENVTIMFRNWLGGSRDLYVINSADKGRSFGSAQKLGAGTWKLNGCPMDGGGLVFDNKNIIHTSWQRQGTIYTCVPGENENIVATGRNCSISSDTKKDLLLISYQEGENTKLVDIKKNTTLLTVKGSYMKSVALRNGKTLCVWELNKSIIIRSI